MDQDDIAGGGRRIVILRELPRKKIASAAPRASLPHQDRAAIDIEYLSADEARQRGAQE